MPPRREAHGGTFVRMLRYVVTPVAAISLAAAIAIGGFGVAVRDFLHFAIAACSGSSRIELWDRLPAPEPARAR